jgi:DNA polymerase III epsilon subunit-like protein
VKPTEKVTDYRTHVSGVRKKDMTKGVEFKKCQRDVAALLKGKILVGHALTNDLKALLITHPRNMIRDTASYKPLMKHRSMGGKGKLKPRSLKELTRVLLNQTIQEGEHSSVIDARCTLEVFAKYRKEWEKGLKTGYFPPIRELAGTGGRANPKKVLEKRAEASAKGLTVKGDQGAHVSGISQGGGDKRSTAGAPAKKKQRTGGPAPKPSFDKKVGPGKGYKGHKYKQTAGFGGGGGGGGGDGGYAGGAAQATRTGEGKADFFSSKKAYP